MRTAIVLVGGKGKRLAQLFPDLNKALVPVGGKPLLEHSLLALKKHGFSRVLLVAGEQATQFKSYTQREADFGMEIRIISEPKALGSAGAVKLVQSELGDSENEFLVCYGGVLISGSLEKLLVAAPAGSLVRLGVSEQMESGDYGAVITDSNGNVTEFLPRASGTRGVVNTGVFVCSKEIFGVIPGPEQFCSFEQDIFPKLKNMKAILLEGRFYDIAVPARYSELNADLWLKQCREENPFLAQLVSAALDGGHIFAQGGLFDLLENVRAQVKGVFAVQKIETLLDSRLARATVRDLIVTNDTKVDDLFLLAGRSAAQVALISEQQLDSSIYDLQANEKQFRQALISFPEVWQKLQTSYSGFQLKGGERKPALFLDRDGVVIKDTNFVRDPKTVELIPGIEKLIQSAHTNGYAVVIVTNQSGLGRGIFTWTDYDLVTKRMCELLAEKKVWIDQVQCAPYFFESERAYGLVRSALRKPRPGMLHSVKEELGIDLERSILVGDSATDLMAGALAGVGRVVLLESGKKDEELKKWQSWPLVSRTKWGKDIEVAEQVSGVSL